MTLQELLQDVRFRQKDNPFGYGIQTADRFTKNIEDCCGSKMCYRFGSTRSDSWTDVMRKAAKTLTYHNQEMIREDALDLSASLKTFKSALGSEIELPKNTLLVFKHVITTPTKDRDGDILRTEGAKPDPNMCGLFNHAHTLPIGKHLAVAEHTARKLSSISAIVDVNDLAHDSVVMIENKMGRFSHGFRAIDFVKNKQESGGKAAVGFDIKSFEIMEWSLVTVPSNVDAQTEEILLDLVSKGQLKSPIVKTMGRKIKEKRPAFSAGGLPITLNINVKSGGEENGTKETKCGCGQKPKEEQQSPRVEEDDKASESKDADSDEMKCPECDGAMKDGVCSKCGYKASAEKGAKAGRVISSSNKGKLSTARDHLEEVYNKEALLSRGGKTMTKEAHRLVSEVIDSAEVMDAPTERTYTASEAMAVFLAKSTQMERERMATSLVAFKTVETNEKVAAEMQGLLGLN